MKNQDIRQAAKESHILLWQIADVYGICDNNFSRLLRRELPPDKKERIFSIINELKKEA